MSSTTTLGQARDRYLAREGLSVETYAEDWAEVRVGPLPLRFPNLEVRKRVLPLHDLHHALTGYNATWIGEAEIAAWELGGGLGEHWIGYVLDLSTLSWAVWITPRRVWRAFVRGRHTRNLYREPTPVKPDLWQRNLRDTKRKLRLDVPDEELRATMADRIALSGWYLLAVPMSLLGLMTLPLMLAVGVWGNWRARTA